MKVYSIKGSKYQSTFFERIDQIPSIYEDSIQNCFENNYHINDIEIKDNNYNYKNYLNDQPVLLIFLNGVVQGFILSKYRPSMKALDCGLYVTTDVKLRDFEVLVKDSIPIYFKFIKDFYDTIWMYCLDVANPTVGGWFKTFLPNCQIKKIRRRYYLCYGYINKHYINNKILKGVDIIASDYKI